MMKNKRYMGFAAGLLLSAGMCFTSYADNTTGNTSVIPVIPLSNNFKTTVDYNGDGLADTIAVEAKTKYNKSSGWDELTSVTVTVNKIKTNFTFDPTDGIYGIEWEESYLCDLNASDGAVNLVLEYSGMDYTDRNYGIYSIQNDSVARVVDFDDIGMRYLFFQTNQVTGDGTAHFLRPEDWGTRTSDYEETQTCVREYILQIAGNQYAVLSENLGTSNGDYASYAPGFEITMAMRAPIYLQAGGQSFDYTDIGSTWTLISRYEGSYEYKDQYYYAVNQNGKQGWICREDIYYGNDLKDWANHGVKNFEAWN